MENVNKFFHNIIPGSYFLFFAFYYLNLKNNLPQFITNYPIHKDTFRNSNSNLLPITLAVIIASLLVGFIFQSIVKIFKDCFIYDLIFCYLVVKKDPKTFIKAKGILINYDLIDADEESDLKKIFFIMNNYLSANNKSNLVDNFWQGNAFWGNLAVGSLVLIVIEQIYPAKDNFLNITIIVMFSLTLYIFLSHLFTMHDIVLKTFVSEIKINKKTKINENTKSPKSQNRNSSQNLSTPSAQARKKQPRH